MATDKHVLEINIEDMLGCDGGCNGCALTSDERSSSASNMSNDTFNGIIDSIDEYIEHMIVSPDYIEPERIDYEYIIADHFLLDEKYLENIYSRSNTLATKFGYQDKGARFFFSTSLIMKTDLLYKKIDNFSKVATDIGIVPIVVFDPKLLLNKKFGKRYMESIAYIKDSFGAADLTVNISNQIVNDVSPSFLYDFAVKNDFQGITFNWVPTIDNVNDIYCNIQGIGKWLCDLDKIILENKRWLYSGFSMAFLRALDAVNNEEPSNLIISPDSLKPSVRNYLQFNPEGGLSSFFQAIGDIPQNERYGFSSVGKIGSEPISKMLDSNLLKVSSRITRSHLAFKSCRECEFLSSCSLMGFHIYNNVLLKTGMADKESSSCPTFARDMFKYYSTNYKKAMDISFTECLECAG